LSAAQRIGDQNRMHHMKQCFLNTGANCKRYICTALYNVMYFQTTELFMHKT
jgi:hypothetical protein